MTDKLKEHRTWIEFGIQLLVFFGMLFAFFSGLREDVAILQNDMTAVKGAIHRIERDYYVPRSGG